MKKKIDIYTSQSTYELQEEFTRILKELGIIDIAKGEYAPKKEGVLIIEFIENQ
jgi:hypothetical protein